MTAYNIFVDSSVWIHYFMRPAELIGALIDSHEGKIFVSALSFYEVTKKLHMLDRNEAFIREAVRFMRENCSIIGVDAELANKAVQWNLKNKLAIADSIIYQSTILSESTLFTLDFDFHGLPHVEVIKG